MQYDPSKVDLSTVCAKSMALGVVLTICFSYLVQGKAVELNWFLICVCVFHLLEFVSTCLWNSSQVDDDSFILTDYDLLLVNVASIAEWGVYRYFGVGGFTLLKSVGVVLIVIGQFFRTFSMYTAKESFNHYIQRTKSDTHVLVQTGIYSVSRHPSYFGFFWWFLGLRLLMNNWVVLAIGGYKIWQFFSRRIRFEEEFLVKFFGNDYVNYRQRVSVWIPFIG